MYIGIWQSRSELPATLYSATCGFDLCNRGINVLGRSKAKPKMDNPAAHTGLRRALLKCEYVMFSGT